MTDICWSCPLYYIYRKNYIYIQVDFIFIFFDRCCSRTCCLETRPCWRWESRLLQWWWVQQTKTRSSLCLQSPVIQKHPQSTTQPIITKFNYCLEAWKSQPPKLINQLIRRYIFCSIIWATRTENFNLNQTVLFRFQKIKNQWRSVLAVEIATWLVHYVSRLWPNLVPYLLSRLTSTCLDCGRIDQYLSRMWPNWPVPAQIVTKISRPAYLLDQALACDDFGY